MMLVCMPWTLPIAIVTHTGVLMVMVCADDCGCGIAGNILVQEGPKGPRLVFLDCGIVTQVFIHSLTLTPVHHRPAETRHRLFDTSDGHTITALTTAILPELICSTLLH